MSATSTARSNTLATRAEKNRMLTREEEFTYITAWQTERDFDARAKVITAYQPMVNKLALKIGSQNGMKGSFDDLVQEGWVALTEAIDKFDLTKKLGFGTYARHPIESRMYRYVMDMSGSCRVGTNIHDKVVFFKGRAERNKLEKKLGREVLPSDAPALAAAMNVPVATYERMSQRIAAVDISLDVSYTHGEIDDETEDHSITNQLSAVDPDPEQHAISTMDGPAVQNILKEAIAALPMREQIVITNRLMQTTRKVPLQKLATQLRLSKKHVREIEENGKALLREWMAARGLTGSDLLD